jgi:hypothetical protein
MSAISMQKSIPAFTVYYAISSDSFEREFTVPLCPHIEVLGNDDGFPGGFCSSYCA